MAPGNNRGSHGQTGLHSSNPNDRLLKFLQAPPDIQAKIDRILSGTDSEADNGPLFCSKLKAAKLLGVCRNTVYRLVAEGRITQVEILPGFLLIRRADLFALAGRSL